MVFLILKILDFRALGRVLMPKPAHRQTALNFSIRHNLIIYNIEPLNSWKNTEVELVRFVRSTNFEDI